MRLSPAERIAHLDDAGLVTADRAALRRSLQVGLARPRRVRFWPRGQRGRRLAVRILRPLLTLEILVPALLAAAWLGLAWHQTARPATLTRDVAIRVMREDGQIVRGVLQRGRAAIVRRGWDGSLELRRWATGWGYETVVLPPDAIVWGWPDHIRLPR